MGNNNICSYTSFWKIDRLHNEYIKIMYDLPVTTHRQTQTQQERKTEKNAVESDTMPQGLHYARTNGNVMLEDP